ncbi:MAG: Tol-Pal system protein TolB [Sulfurimonas sp.]|uniref:Tol-Pal system protein TolB n=1 Tax=Sulfurimonas sp. TaxID=2022749 RepID=UPI0026211BCC|nr:Tol-Pal system protein TolB [Sulfurimonas sp.]MCW8894234.1 Tol-Pal system protein TolB [Sulfurimonas sp.]MCW8954025.1 Tol-Pal system protein TolB [Sulfurimonas sp.]MCW9067304.1 Tol-Pal system protein TolB [Sulfurimonas sp.]
MKILISFLMAITVAFASDATIEVIKRVDSLPTIAVEDSSESYDNKFKMKFFKSLIADLNVLSIFNVDRYHREVKYDANEVAYENKDMDYVLRYRLVKSDNGSLNVNLKILTKNDTVFVKNYKINNPKIYMFVSHTIAYDINKFMGEDPVEWMKRKVIFSRIIAPQKSELVIADYTLEYQHVVVKGGFNIFPKWANKEQTAFYYSSLDEKKPTLKYVDIKTAKSKVIGSSDGMMICSDVSDDGSKLLLTKAPNGQPDIYMYDVNTKITSRLTKYGGIDVSGSFMGKDSIVFVSDRLGYPNIFSKNINSNSVEQMVYYGKSNISCSTFGEYIVYKSRETSNAFANNTFNLHLISTETDFIRRLTAVGVNEFPRFSVDGDAIIFIKNYKAQSSIGIIRLNHNKNYLFPLKYGKVQSLDW